MSNGAHYQVAEAHSFGIEPITCHAWNKDKTGIQDDFLFFSERNTRDVVGKSRQGAVSKSEIFCFQVEVSL